MYLLYDAIQLRNSCLGNSLLIKRTQWTSVTRDLNSLNVARLQNAARELAADHVTKDPLVRRLLKNLTAIGVQVPGSFFHKLQMRAEIRGLLVREGMPAFWMTINPSDLQNPLVLVLAGVQLSTDNLSKEISTIRQDVATADPVAVARFFHYTCRAVLDGLLGGRPSKTGVLGDISNYFGVVESNGRGMLHLHALVWVRGNLGFAQLRDRVLADDAFANRLICFLESVIMHSIHNPDLDSPDTVISRAAPSTSAAESDPKFMEKIFHDSNSVARIKQLHSKHHTATCFKYSGRLSTKNNCRFGMPRDLVEVSGVDNFGIVHLARNNAWVNPWNPYIASCIRSNHDISWIPTVSKSLSLLYYITNYATKDDASPWQMVTKAALLRQMIDRASSNVSPTTTDLRVRQNGMNNFALRCFNSLSQDREISGVQVASTLLQLPFYYTLNYNFTRINLWWLRQYVRAVIQPEQIQRTSSTNPIAEEPCNYDHVAAAPTSIFDNYKFRGDLLSPLSIFEYCMLVGTKRIQDSSTHDITFNDQHPKYHTHLQRLARSQAQTATVTLQGELTEFQAAEDSVPGGHPTTTAIQNDLAEILLGLFVPWENLASLVQRIPTQAENPHSKLHQIWTLVEPTLPAYCRTFAQNIDLLRKSKDDCQADAVFRKRTSQHTSMIDHELADPPYSDSDSGNEAPYPLSTEPESLSSETLIAALFSTSTRWAQEVQDAQTHIAALAANSFRRLSLQPQYFRPIRISDNLLYESSGLQLVPLPTLQEWQIQLKRVTTLETQDPYAGSSTNDVSYLDDFNLDITNGFLVPLLTDSDISSSTLQRDSRVGENPTGASLTLLVCETVPLNGKQRLVVQKILSQALDYSNHPSGSHQNQTLLYIGGEGGVGKSQIVKAIVAGMDLINRKDEIILMAPTGAAADIIGGNTYHTSLGISLNRFRQAGVSARVRRLWSQKTIMIIDEVSMIDQSALGIINMHCKAARLLDRDSSDLFGGLPVVILMGDFHQFPPVQGQPLWKLPRSETDQDGKLIWSRFKQVVILDEQMRQTEDLQYRSLLTRARSGTFTYDDMLTLNSKVITSLDSPGLQKATAITKLNALRHVINRFQIERFARANGQKIFIFPALHTRTKSSDATNLRLRADDLLSLPEQGTKIPFPGLLLYTPSMPAMILTNICTPAGLVNGATGKAIGIVVDVACESSTKEVLSKYHS